MSKVLWDFVEEFAKDLIEQLKEDDKRWGNTWFKRPIEGQEMRTRETFRDYFDQFENAGVPIPWLRIAGGAMICWLREKYPDMSPFWRGNWNPE